MADSNSFVLPSFQKGVGPFPEKNGTWIERPNYQLGRRAVADLYLALMTDVSLDLIDSKERLVIEGRFAGDPIFARALASLRPKQTVYLAPAFNSISYGALRLIEPDLLPETELTEVMPLPFDIASYAKRWNERTQK
jgi:hypothetical protein